ncbi:hypothetical protein OHT76_01065 [Streptomyces sp. NBC_00287]|uniref:hypothetical protein n=1 Tax=Streptomyces sp. NBC_00287 TaxID=2975702 RepID=UPI002E2BB82A|nr:hypothetical protein [Streptomyces sp. NBC_00287]
MRLRHAFKTAALGSALALGLMALPAAAAVPAQAASAQVTASSTAATGAAAASDFEGWSTNGHSYGSVTYSYWGCDSGGYCSISVGSPAVQDFVWGNTWGSVLQMHYTDRSGPHVSNMLYADPNGYTNGRGFNGSGYKDVRFYVCNWKPATNEIYSCGRLYKV